MRSTVPRHSFTTLLAVVMLATPAFADGPTDASAGEAQTSSGILRRMLLAPPIQQELALSPEQVKEVNALGIPLDSPSLPFSKAIDPFSTILTVEQLRALKPYVITSHGVRAFAIPEVQESLQLSDDQKLRVGAILGVLRADLQSYQALASQAQNAKIMELERDVFQPLEDKAYDDVLALLTGEQRTVWETIAKPRPRRRPR